MIRPGDWRRELTVPLQSIQAELNRLFEEYWQPAAGPQAAAPKDAAAAGRAEVEPATWTPAIDLWESPAETTLLVDLPGVRPEAIDLSLAGNILTLRGTNEPGGPPVAGGSGKGRIAERPVGPFLRQITLVDEVDFERVEAQASDGILTIRLPKRPPGQPRTIPIRSATS